MAHGGNFTGRVFGLVLLCMALPLKVAAAQPGWQAEWENTLQAARKEGQLVMFVPPGEEPLYRLFESKYPGIKVSFIPGGGAERVHRIMSERRAEKYLEDLYIGGGGSQRDILHRAKVLDPIKPALILPEVVDSSKWWGGKHVYLDDEGQHILSFNGIAQTYFHYNTKLVDPREFKSYWDFLNLKWKGKIVAREPLASGTDGALRFLYHNPEIGPQFLRRFLSEMDLTATRDNRQFADWLATGRFAISALQSTDRSDLQVAKKQGLPINWFDSKSFKEGVPLSTSSGNMALLNRAPHPNAAKVFINWLLSREGQIAYQKIEGQNDSLRIDIPKDDVPLHIRRQKGVKYTLLTDPAYLDLEPVRKLVDEIWRTKK